ncbi:MAG: helix-turn-helix domain-containing protein [Patescibacteria group bacterium]
MKSQYKAEKSLILSQQLVKLGLTSDEALCYLALLEEGSQSATEIAEAIDVFPNAVYRLMIKLEEKGFVVRLNTSPKTFQAIPPNIAIEAFYEKAKKDLEKIKIESIASLSSKTLPSPKTMIEVLTGKDSTFSRYVEFANQTKKELLVISIGEPVPDDIKIASAKAKERGVSQRFIFHVYNKENENLLKSWVKMGVEVRHHADAGYHLMIFDGKKCILVSSNPDNTEERTGMVIYSENLTNALRNYFYSIWNKSLEVV